MKNSLSIVIVLTIVLSVGLGCGLVSRLREDASGTSNVNTAKTPEKTITDKAIDVAVGGEKIGVPECDELFEALAVQARSADDNYVTKATKEFFLNKIKESIKKSIEENKNDKVQMAKDCKQYKAELDKQYAAETPNQ